MLHQIVENKATRNAVYIMTPRKSKVTQHSFSLPHSALYEAEILFMWTLTTDDGSSQEVAYVLGHFSD